MMMIKQEKRLNPEQFFHEVFTPFTMTLERPVQGSTAKGDSDEESFQPEYHQIKKLGIKANKKRISTGGWNSHENFVYLKFMLQNSEDFITEKNRRRLKVFYRLSKILKKRTPDQCRSHHQKLQIKCQNDLASIMREVNQKIKKAVAEEYVNEQSRVKKNEFDKMIELSTFRKGQALEVVSRQNWFEIKKNQSKIRITIDQAAIKSW